MKRLLCAACFFGALVAAGAQEAKTKSGAIPPEVYYLMPSFGQGMVFFSGQAPAQGMLNICAVDNTLRFKDRDGKELAASNDDNVVKVQIDTVLFIRDDGVYYRMYPVSPDMGIALKRDVVIESDARTGAYGMVSRTSAIRENSTYYADGVAYNLDNDKEYPYRVSETLFLYRGNDVIVFSRKNLRKLFPARKNDIDTFFKSGGSIPQELPDALAFLARWAEE